jgi:hypothetical protein
MKSYLQILLSCSLLFLATIASASPFTPLKPDEPYGVISKAWRFASSLSQDANGVIELCYAEAGGAERVLGRVDVRPFQSSSPTVPDLRILFTTAEIEGKKRLILLVGYGIRSGAFVADVPALTTHSLVFVGAPKPGPMNDLTLAVFGDGAVKFKPDGGMEGVRGRLYFRYVEKP